MTVKFWRDDEVFFVELANPPVNAINLAVRQGLHDAMLAIQAATGLERVLLMGSETIFAAGGDAREFDAPPIAPHLPDVLAMIEASDIPWIAVINGAALGGGLELALACRYRIASPRAQLGLPEVLLGIVPGAGGTQRLPRLIGFAAALEMITSGKATSAEASLEAGLLNLVDANPMQVALAITPANLATVTPVGQLPNPKHFLAKELLILIVVVQPCVTLYRLLIISNLKLIKNFCFYKNIMYSFCWLCTIL